MSYNNKYSSLHGYDFVIVEYRWVDQSTAVHRAVTPAAGGGWLAPERPRVRQVGRVPNRGRHLKQPQKLTGKGRCTPYTCSCGEKSRTRGNMPPASGLRRRHLHPWAAVVDGRVFTLDLFPAGKSRWDTG